MKIDLRSDKPLDEATTWLETGRTAEDWFALLDTLGGPDLGRQAIGDHLRAEFALDPWWIDTLLVEYERARGAKETDGRALGYAIDVERRIDASPRACFDAFATGAALDHWFGTDNEIDFRDGGAWANADGNRAVLRKVVAPKSIVLTWHQSDAAPNTPVELHFVAAGNATDVKVMQERLQTRPEADGLRRAWSEALARLQATLDT
ncbi:SRPBCC domain-containing protein [Lysobacter sp. KIS68-7]|uniref:SRPBCC family protein n=1 Tax=Lysobacter sp. KIS68-7 TaxID=2904252 RepID=UPI001E2E8065|nr:SRPBCC domain-containing protein [Lysobacter sp. KIS68-7]UHQ19305.1 SRPBCC domain-containing protein [Lysobacter sp. KIS68-7]